MNKNGKQYYREIKTIFPSMGKNERRLLKRYKVRITELCDANSNISYASIIKELGTPIDVITDYYENVETEYLMKRLQPTKLIRRLIYIMLIITLILLVVSIAFNYKLYIDATQAIPAMQETIIR